MAEFIPDAETPSTKAPDFTPDQPENAVQAFKEWLLRQPEPGHGQTIQFPKESGLAGVDLGKYVRKAGEYVIPSSWPGVAAMGASMIPGVGVWPALGRITAGAAGGAGAEYLRGADPTKGALAGGGMVAGSEILGGVTRGVSNKISSALGPESLMGRIGRAYQEIMPEVFGGKDGNEVIKKVWSGEAQDALSTSYRQGLEKVFAGVPKDTVVVLPALTELGFKGEFKGNPSYFTPADALTKIQSLERSLSSATGAMSRRKTAGVEANLLDEARKQFENGIMKAAQDPTLASALQEVSAHYGQGKALIRMIVEGRDKAVKGTADEFLGMSPIEQGIQLEKNQLTSGADLKKHLPAAAYDLLEKITRRGESNAIAVSQPGQGLRMQYIHSGLPIRAIPSWKAPQPIGDIQTPIGPIDPDTIAAFVRRMTVPGLMKLGQ